MSRPHWSLRGVGLAALQRGPLCDVLFGVIVCLIPQGSECPDLSSSAILEVCIINRAPSL